MLTRLATEARVFGAATMFLTRIPCPRWVGYETTHLARSTAYFPLVGVIVGLAGGVVAWAGSRVWPPFVAAALSTTATVWLTGAFHEDALADSCDGFGGGWEPAQVLAIMKDSRIGSYGAAGLALALLTKVGALAAIGETNVDTMVRALVVAHTLGRWSSLPLIWALPYVRQDLGGEGETKEAKSAAFAASVTGPRLVVGSLLAAVTTTVALAPLGPATIGAALTLAGLVTALGARYFRRRIGGMTGDCLGAANQCVELATYLLLASAWLRR